MTGQEFGARLHKLGPFETSPRLAVACSGGADSIALLGLIGDWALQRNGKVLAMIVDHRLRPESTREAAQVAATAKQLGVEACVLTRTDGSLRSNVQQHAREARYRLLSSGCRQRGIPHLFLAHHRNDQAETVYMRAARNSGVDGLAGMAEVSELRDVRILRPLLNIPKTRLRATASAMGLPVIEDPSNDDLQYERVRVRRELAEATKVDAAIKFAGRNGLERRRKELLATDLLSKNCAMFPEGYAVLDIETLNCEPVDIVCRCLAAICAMIGGRQHPPRRARTSRLYDAIVSGKLTGGRTMGGCHIIPIDRRLLIIRETAAIEKSMAVLKNGRWDGRFLIEMSSPTDGLEISALGEAGFHELRENNEFVERVNMPRAVLPTLPAIRGLEGIRYVPHLCYSKGGDPFDGKIRFAPIRPLQAARFTL